MEKYALSRWELSLLQQLFCASIYSQYWSHLAGSQWRSSVPSLHTIELQACLHFLKILRAAAEAAFGLSESSEGLSELLLWGLWRLDANQRRVLLSAYYYAETILYCFNFEIFTHPIFSTLRKTFVRPYSALRKKYWKNARYHLVRRV